MSLKLYFIHSTPATGPGDVTISGATASLTHSVSGGPKTLSQTKGSDSTRRSATITPTGSTGQGLVLSGVSPAIAAQRLLLDLARLTYWAQSLPSGGGSQAIYAGLYVALWRSGTGKVAEIWGNGTSPAFDSSSWVGFNAGTGFPQFEFRQFQAGTPAAEVMTQEGDRLVVEVWQKRDVASAGSVGPEWGGADEPSPLNTALAYNNTTNDYRAASYVELQSALYPGGTIYLQGETVPDITPPNAPVITDVY